MARFGRIAEFLRKYERHISTGALFSGFVWDYITLGSIENLYANAILVGYFLVVGVGLIVLNRRRSRDAEYQSAFLIPLVQFCFGNLASGLFVLYSQSGTFVGNWLFLSLFAAFLLANEFMRSRYNRTALQLAVYYFLLFGYVALIVPVIENRLGAYVFLHSALAAAALYTGYLLIFRTLARGALAGQRVRLYAATTVITAGYILLYFFNFIPPVPLAIKDIGVFHSVARNASGGYTVSYEEKKLFGFFETESKVFNRGPGESAYCFSSVYAPVGLTIPIFHRWEWYDEKTGVWATRSYFSFSISGGRTTGYRGYSEVTALTAGAWRCSVETSGGALIGRIGFTVADATSTPELVIGTR